MGGETLKRKCSSLSFLCFNRFAAHNARGRKKNPMLSFLLSHLLSFWERTKRGAKMNCWLSHQDDKIDNSEITTKMARKLGNVFFLRNYVSLCEEARGEWKRLKQGFAMLMLNEPKMWKCEQKYWKCCLVSEQVFLFWVKSQLQHSKLLSNRWRHKSFAILNFFPLPTGKSSALC